MGQRLNYEGKKKQQTPKSDADTLIRWEKGVRKGEEMEEKKKSEGMGGKGKMRGIGRKGRNQGRWRKRVEMEHKK